MGGPARTTKTIRLEFWGAQLANSSDPTHLAARHSAGFGRSSTADNGFASAKWPTAGVAQPFHDRAAGRQDAKLRTPGPLDRDGRPPSPETWQEVGRLTAIAAIRTVLNYFWGAT
jgi:hypothetical protein